VKPAAAFVAFWVLAAAAAPVHAAGAGELGVALRAGIGMINYGNSSWGPAGGVEAEYGITDAWAIRASLEGSVHSSSGDMAMGTGMGTPGGTWHSDAVLAGVTYTVDVLRLVPYAELQLGVAQIVAPAKPTSTTFASELGLGGDYYATRKLRIGVSFQYLYRPQDLFENPQGLGNAPFTFSATARFSWIF
jgi:hypothetical protein